MDQLGYNSLSIDGSNLSQSPLKQTNFNPCKVGLGLGKTDCCVKLGSHLSVFCSGKAAYSRKWASVPAFLQKKGAFTYSKNAGKSHGLFNNAISMKFRH